MVELLEPLVWGDREPQALPRGARQLGRGLLAELAEPLGRALEVGPHRGVGERQQAHRETDDDRLHARLEQAHPGRHPEERVERGPADASGPHKQHRAEDGQSSEQPRDREGRGVDRRDDDERDHVVDHGHGDHESPQAVRKARADEREQAEHEGGVGRHRDSPAVGGRAPRVEDEVDRDGDGHAADRGQQRQREAPPLP